MSVLALLLLSCTSALTAAPILSGSYVFVYRQWCQGTMTADVNASHLIDELQYNGGATFTILSSANFDPEKGKVKVSGFYHNGSPFLLTFTGSENGTDGIPLGEVTLSSTGKYKTTATTFKLGPQTFHALYSQVDKNGIAHIMTFMGLVPGTITCSTQGEATLQ
jgi:hypothetical protein